MFAQPRVCLLSLVSVFTYKIQGLDLFLVGIYTPHKVSAPIRNTIPIYSLLGVRQLVQCMANKVASTACLIAYRDSC